MSEAYESTGETAGCLSVRWPDKIPVPDNAPEFDRHLTELRTQLLQRASTLLSGGQFDPEQTLQHQDREFSSLLWDMKCSYIKAGVDEREAQSQMETHANLLNLACDFAYEERGKPWGDKVSESSRTHGYIPPSTRF